MWIIITSLLMALVVWWVAGAERMKWREALTEVRGLWVILVLLGFAVGMLAGRVTNQYSTTSVEMTGGLNGQEGKPASEKNEADVP